jgi:hypothetical protein
MAVAHDAVSESHTGTAGNGGASSFTWNHVPTGTPRGAVVFVFTRAVDPLDTSVTYGGTTMNLVPYYAGVSSAEPGSVRAYWLDNVASGTQAVVVNRTNTATVMYAVCATVTAAGAIEVYNAGVKTVAGTTTNTAATSTSAVVGTGAVIAIDDGSPGTNSQRYYFQHSGLASVTAAGTGSSTNTNFSIDFGNAVVSGYWETTPGQGSRNVGPAAEASDDIASIALAVREAPPPDNPPTNRHERLFHQILAQ